MPKQGTVVEYCGCVKAGTITAKCAVGSTQNKTKPTTEVPWFNANKGAEAQDEMYGKGNRVHNVRMKEGKLKGSTCTVCGRVKEI